MELVFDKINLKIDENYTTHTANGNSIDQSVLI